MQYGINRTPVNIFALSPGKIDKYEYLTAEEILSPQKYGIMKEAKLTYFPFGEGFEKQTKTIKMHGVKQVEPLKFLEFSSKESPSLKGFIELENIKKQGQKINRRKMIYIMLEMLFRMVLS